MLVEIPVSVGELLDKITILEIKLSHADGMAKQNIEKELVFLTSKINQDDIPRGFNEMLKEVNTRLWDVEDSIRIKESNREFDDDFIYYARMVYMYNDTRAAIKRKINELTDSFIVEEKIFS